MQGRNEVFKIHAYKDFKTEYLARVTWDLHTTKHSGIQILLHLKHSINYNNLYHHITMNITHIM